MTQINARVPTSVSMLQDSKTYTVGQDGSIERGKTGGALTKKETIAAGNQKVLDALVMQLKAEYGYDKILGSELQLPEKLASGKKAITGRDIKLLAEQALARANARVDTGPMLTGLRQALSVDPPSPTGVLGALRNAIPEGSSPQTVRLLIGAAMAQLSTNQVLTLTAMLASQEMADTQRLLDLADTHWKEADSSQKTPNQTDAQKTAMREGLASTKGLRTIVDSFSESLRLVHAGRVNARLAPPPDARTTTPTRQGQHSWLTAPAPLKASLASLGIADPVTKARQMGVSDMGIRSDNLFRGNACGEKILKSLALAGFSGQTGVLFNALKPMLKTVDRNYVNPDIEGPNGIKGAVAAALAGGKLQTARNLTFDAIRSSPSLINALADGVKLVSGMKQDILAKYPGENCQSLMLKAFNGLVGIPFTAEMHNSSSKLPKAHDQDIMRGMAVFLQGEFASIAPGTPFGDFLAQTIPGWNEMIAPPQG